MVQQKYSLGDLFLENDRIIQIVGYGNSKGVYYCQSHYTYINPVTLSDLKLSKFEYRTENELNKLEVVDR